MATPSLPWWGAPDSLSETNLPATTDFAVVGGGVMGLCTAYWLARGGARPLIIEQDRCGAGATGRNGGFLAVGTTESYRATIARFGRIAARQILRLTVDNRAGAAELITEEEIACDLRSAGRLHLSLGLEEDDRLKRTMAVLVEDGCPTEWLDRAGVQGEIGTPLGPGITGALFSPESALIHPGKLVRGLAGAARRRGASLTRARVERVEPDGAGVRVLTSRGIVLAGRVLLAVNAWTATLLPRYRDSIVPVRGQMLAYAPTGPVFRAGITAMLTETEEYWQQAANGSIIIGGCRAVGPGRDEGVLATEPSPEVQHALEGVLPALFPQLGPLRVTHRWAGPMAFTRDRLPLVGPLPDLPACWIAAGFSGHGMAMAFTLGRLVGSVLLTGRSDPRLNPFSLDRLTGATA